MIKIYLDDIRTPIDSDWIIVRTYDEFVDLITKISLEEIDIISLDHDLGKTSMEEYFKNVVPNYSLNYDNIEEKTGYDCVKWLINHYYDLYPNRINLDRSIKKVLRFKFPEIKIHSANAIGSANMMGYINNFLANEGQPQSCIRWRVEHKI